MALELHISTAQYSNGSLLWGVSLLKCQQMQSKTENSLESVKPIHTLQAGDIVEVTRWSMIFVRKF